MASLRREVNLLNAVVDELLVVVADIKKLEMKYQRLIAETAMLRLFYAIDGMMEHVSLKLLTDCGYCDGTAPARILRPFRSIAAASAYIAGRKPPGQFVKWATLKNVRQNLNGLLLNTEHFLKERGVIDPVLEDMRHVRNHIAHRNRGTGRKFSGVVWKIYPTRPRGISPGKLLLSQRTAYLGAPLRGHPSIIEQYLRWTKVAAKTLTKA